MRVNISTVMIRRGPPWLEGVVHIREVFLMIVPYEQERFTNYCGRNSQATYFFVGVFSGVLCTVLRRSVMPMDSKYSTTAVQNSTYVLSAKKVDN
jgi:hypothetical protein